MFITFEGGEGAGKSTQARLLFDRLRAEGYDTQLTREPGGTPIASAIRALLLYPQQAMDALARDELVPEDEQLAEPILPDTELLLLSAARCQHVERIKRWLAQPGAVVISDRFADATYAYQGFARGVDRESIDQVQRIAMRGLRPDLTFLLDLPVSTSKQRKEASLQPSLFDDLEADATGLRAAGSPQARDERDVPRVDVEMNRLDREAREFHVNVLKGYRALAAEEPQRWVVLDARRGIAELADDIWLEVSKRLAAAGMAKRQS